MDLPRLRASNGWEQVMQKSHVGGAGMQRCVPSSGSGQGSCLSPCLCVGMQQCSGSRLGLLEEDGFIPVLTDTCYPWQSKGMFTLPTFPGRELCFLWGWWRQPWCWAAEAPSKPWMALWDLLSAALGLLTVPMAWLEHGAGSGTTATWAGTAALWAPFCPWRVCEAPESLMCKHDEVPEQPSERGLGTSE